MIKNCMKRNVISVSQTATIREAASLMVEQHIGLLPVVDEKGKPVGAIGLGELLTLELPDFFSLLPDLDFVHDFGAVETTRPSPEELDQPVTALMQPAILVKENTGMLRAITLMLKHNLYDLVIVSDEGALVGIASRADVATEILSRWNSVPRSKS